MDPRDEQNGEEIEPTPDDILEEARRDPTNISVGDDQLTEDNDPPLTDPEPVPEDPTDSTPTPDDTHPSNDTDTDDTEIYNQGL